MEKDIYVENVVEILQSLLDFNGDVYGIINLLFITDTDKGSLT